MKALYATIIQNLLAKGVDENDVVKNLVTHLKEKGRLKLLSGILGELKTLKAKQKVTGTILEVANESEKAKALKGAQDAGFSAETVQVNTSLIRGWRLRSGGTLIDRSGKRALIDLYGRIVS